ncbi:MAG: RdgB/HAM1 family non-canonical purine NTP pyrophosphatase [Rhodospirillaceae bacterium]|jgi:XTP/dITP diphosphohydrolase|nr:RdgB/HAM1 family non-canonical purine NTP pyrophosphatase [Rhodospirillaceae bacterium]MBT4939694.1 RdgB/HAM1 family non-canonical purine NTP pyrophosphatase [Rhodospirillaceae bacterium]MBT7957174.1 RdgB/HAM1 family non-canonical purine NTP pyrophosphatase [Rhodospirillaceae bacterium]
MPRKFTEKKLVIASHNPGKVFEINDLLQDFGVEVVSAGDLGLPEPIEDGLTFVANAEIKARAATEGSGLPALADDSGLVVPLLDGDPGIYSARWAEPGKDFDLAMKKIRDAIVAKGKNPEGQNAYFACALSLCWPNGEIETLEGTVHGTLTFPPKGKKGFGYDPIFVPINYQLTFGEMDQTEKHRISHRADAFQKLVNACFK